jgi:Lon protease-like protein
MMAERLPLFPLNVVLFPTGVIPLHIFEERYQEMVADVLEGNGRFGVIYHDPDKHGPFQGDPGQVGCVAVLKEHQALVEGRSMILAAGMERFMIQEYIDSTKRYYEAMVEPYSDWEIEASSAEARRTETLERFKSVLASAGDGAGRMPSVQVQDDVSFPIAAMIDVDRAWQQDLLELRRELDRLDLLDALLNLASEQSRETENGL